MEEKNNSAYFKRLGQGPWDFSDKLFVNKNTEVYISRDIMHVGENKLNKKLINEFRYSCCDLAKSTKDISEY